MADKQISDLTSASALTDGSLFVIEQAGAAKSANWGMMKNYISPGVAAQYSTSATYDVGDYVIYNGQLYRCTTAITTAESWTAAHWTAAVLGNDVGELKSALKEVYTPLNGSVTGRFIFDRSGYYTNVDTITPGTQSCCEYIIPSNLKSIHIAKNNNLGSQFYVLFLLDASKTIITSVQGLSADVYLYMNDYPNAVYIQCNDFGAYYYTIELEYLVNADEQDVANLELAARRIGYIPECTFTGGKFIHKDGTVRDSNAGWQISSPIHLNAGEEIFVRGLGYLSIIAMISKCDANGDNIVPLVISYGNEGDINEYSYKATGSEYVRVCFDNIECASIIISMVDRDVTGNIAKTGELVYGYWCSAAGEITATTAGAYIKVPIPIGSTYISIAYPNLGTDPATISNLYTGRVIFLNSQSESIASYIPQEYAVSLPCNGIYYAAYPVPENASYFCATTKLSNWNECQTIIIKNSKTIRYTQKTVNELNGVRFSDEELRKKTKFVDNDDWSDKTWLLVGDSLTHKNIRAAISYYDYIADDTGVQFINKGANGQGYMRGTWFYNALSDSISGDDFDFCTFFGSGNDCYYYSEGDIHPYTDEQWPVALGNVTDTGTSTICGNINRTFDRFIELYPLKKFGVITPTPWKDQANADGTITGTHMDDYVNKMIAICERRGIPYLDLYHTSGMRPWNEAFRNAYYSNDDGNGVHPDSNGHKWFYPMIKQFLKQFIVTP